MFFVDCESGSVASLGVNGTPRKGIGGASHAVLDAGGLFVLEGVESVCVIGSSAVLNEDRLLL